MIIEDVPQAFLELCQSGLEFATEPPLSQNSALVSPTTSDPDKPQDKTRLTKNYTDAYTDTHGLHSGQGFIIKTGPAWPKSEGPNARPVRRELRPVNGHPILPIWDDILTCIDLYLNEVNLPFTAAMPLSFANVEEENAFCPLVVAIGVEPEKVAFEDAKAVAEYVKLNILADAGFDDVEVAIWEFETFFSGSGPKLPTLDPDLHRHLTQFYHPFTSTLGISVAPLKQPRQEPGYEGSLGLFITRGDGAEILALTAAHVVRPPPMFTDNKGLSLRDAERRYEEVVALGNGAWMLAIKKIQDEVGCLQESITMDEQSAQRLRGRLENGMVDTNGTIAAAIRAAEQSVENLKESIRQLNLLHNRVTHLMPLPSNRCIGRVLFADPIGVSSDGYTRDWAVLGIRKDAFGDDFEGNTLYIGMSPVSLITTLSFS